MTQVRFEEGGDWTTLPFSPQAMLLLNDIDRAFCAGAWASVIVLSQAAIEATIRQVSYQDYETNIAKLIGRNKKVQELRNMRNDLLHVGPPGTKSRVWGVPGGGIAETHANLEETAKLGIRCLFQVIYAQREA